STSQKKLADDQLLASYIDRWVVDTHLNAWANWRHPLLSGGYQCVRQDAHDSLQKICTWLSSRVWPRRYLPVEHAFKNFRMVSTDFLTVFHRHAEWKEWKVPAWCTEKSIVSSMVGRANTCWQVKKLCASSNSTRASSRICCLNSLVQPI